VRAKPWQVRAKDWQAGAERMFPRVCSTNETAGACRHFLRTTLVGGILFLVPIVVVLIVLNKALAIAHKLVDPLAARLPFESLIGFRTPLVLAITLLVIFCFVTGLFARTALAKRSVGWLESSVLSNVPGYQF